MAPEELKARLATAAFAFGGYDATNLGRTEELLAHSAYGPIVRDELDKASQSYAQITGRPMDLVARVEAARETTWETYAEAVVLVLATEMAQVRLLEEVFCIAFRSARLAYGYSLGELAALVSGGVFQLPEMLRISLPLADDTIELARDVTLAVLFSRGLELPLREVRRLCVHINQQGAGVLGIAGHLTPNSLLVMGQGDTLDRFAGSLIQHVPGRLHLRKKDSRWAPLHTPIIRERSVRDRFAVSLHTLQDGLTVPTPPIVALATGECSYDDTNAREMLDRWIDHPQRLWDAVYKTFTSGIETVIHVGPKPSIIPATFRRVRDNVEAQTKVSLGMRALAGIISRPWLKALLPAGTALLRSLYVEHVVLEDWLLEQDVNQGGKKPFRRERTTSGGGK
jgi:[acyl-carrier-protein] S-malonyltransferase